jgi:uncharacterized protein
MDFDRLSVVLLVPGQDMPDLDAAEAAVLQDAHMSYLVDLHEAGHLLAAGPLLDDQFRGLSILGVAPEEARRLMDQDPAVQAGRLGAVVMPWLVPAGAMTFTPAHFPRSVSEVQ